MNLEETSIKKEHTLKFYIEYRGNIPIRYGFGKDVIATMMALNDYKGFKTPLEAFNDYCKNHPEFNGKYGDYWNTRQKVKNK